MLSLHDRLDISDLYSRYAHSVDAGLYDQWCDCFVTDGQLSVPVNNILVRGREELGAFARAYFERSAGLERHIMSNVLIQTAPEGVRGSCYLTMLLGGAGRSSPRLTTTGTYSDQLARTSDGWRFVDRVLNVDLRVDDPR
jgi:hypothetical protein